MRCSKEEMTKPVCHIFWKDTTGFVSSVSEPWRVIFFYKICKKNFLTSYFFHPVGVSHSYFIEISVRPERFLTSRAQMYMLFQYIAIPPLIFSIVFFNLRTSDCEFWLRLLKVYLHTNTELPPEQKCVETSKKCGKVQTPSSPRKYKHGYD